MKHDPKWGISIGGTSEPRIAREQQSPEVFDQLDVLSEWTVGIDWAIGADYTTVVAPLLLLQSFERAVPVGGTVTIKGAIGGDEFSFCLVPPPLAGSEPRAFRRVEGDLWERTR